MGGFASDRLGIGRCKGGPQMLRSPKLQKRASDPDAYLGVEETELLL